MLKLQELIDAIGEGNLQFEDVQEYLDLITQLIGAGNLTASQQKALLDNINTNIQSITNAITGTAAADTKFDVKTPSTIINKFPFCLPFDIYNIFNLLSAEPKIPEFDIPLKMDGVFDYTIEIDLSQFDRIAVVVRWFLYAVFLIGLILVTNSLIGRG